MPKLVVAGFLICACAFFGVVSVARAGSVDVLVGPGGLADPRLVTGTGIQYASALARLSDGSILIADSQYPKGLDGSDSDLDDQEDFEGAHNGEDQPYDGVQAHDGEELAQDDYPVDGDGPFGDYDEPQDGDDHPQDGDLDEDDQAQANEVGRSRVLRLAPDGTLTVLVGPGGQIDPATTPIGPLNYVCGIAELRDGSIAIADTNNNRIVRLSRHGQLSVLVGGQGAVVDAASATGLALNHPHGLLAKSDGSLWIADSNNDRVLELSPDQSQLRVIVGAGGNVDPAVAVGEAHRPSRLELLPNGSIAIGGWEHRVLELHDDKATLTVLIGHGAPALAQNVDSELDMPSGVAVQRNGSLWVADSMHHRIVELSADRTRLSVVIGPGGSIPYPGKVGELQIPRTLLTLPDGSVLIGDTYNGRVLLVRPNDDLETRLRHLVRVGERADGEKLAAIRKRILAVGLPREAVLDPLWTNHPDSLFSELPRELVHAISAFSRSGNTSATWRALISLSELG